MLYRSCLESRAYRWLHPHQRCASRVHLNIVRDVCYATLRILPCGVTTAQTACVEARINRAHPPTPDPPRPALHPGIMHSRTSTRPEPHILLFRRPLGTDPVTGQVDPELEREAKEKYAEELSSNVRK